MIFQRALVARWLSCPLPLIGAGEGRGRSCFVCMQGSLSEENPFLDWVSKHSESRDLAQQHYVMRLALRTRGFALHRRDSSTNSFISTSPAAAKVHSRKKPKEGLEEGRRAHTPIRAQQPKGRGKQWGCNTALRILCACL